METVERYTVVITDCEPNNIYPGSKEIVRVECKEIGFCKSFTFRTGNLKARRSFVLGCLTEIMFREVQLSNFG
jgi:hypothetical protein